MESACGEVCPVIVREPGSVIAFGKESVGLPATPSPFVTLI